MNTLFFSWLYWNPNRDAFTIPGLNHPLRWYGLFFVFGFIVGYWIILSIFTKYLKRQTPLKANDTPIPDQAVYLADRLMWFVVGGTIIGARLGHVLFYDWPRYQHRLLDILKIWEGGLASHGGTLGILIGLVGYRQLIKKQYPDLTFLKILDMLCIPVALAACCIRLGNFMNQEILGTQTTVPWAIIFGDPADGSISVPRHPVQLYEAIAYLVTFIFLFTLWKSRDGASPPKPLRAGGISGLFFILVFGSRFLIEFYKLPSSLMIDESYLQTGQLLSIPCIIAGFLMLFFGDKGRKEPIR